MKTSNFLAGMQILAPYYGTTGDYTLAAEHDVIHAYATDRPLSDEDAAKMVSLGWVQEEVDEGEHYDPSEGWAAYV